MTFKHDNSKTFYLKDVANYDWNYHPIYQSLCEIIIYVYIYQILDGTLIYNVCVYAWVWHIYHTPHIINPFI